MDKQKVDARKWAALSGIGAILLFGTGTALWGFEMPAAGANAREVVSFYADNSARIVAGTSLSLVATALLVVSGAALRRVLDEVDGDDMLATVAFGGTLVAATAGATAEAITMAGALRAADGSLSEPLARAMFEIAHVLGFNVAGIGVGVLALAFSAVALRGRALMPRWLAVVIAILGLSLLTPLSPVTFTPGLLALAAGVALLLRNPPVGLGRAR